MDVKVQPRRRDGIEIRCIGNKREHLVARCRQPKIRAEFMELHGAQLRSSHGNLTRRAQLNGHRFQTQETIRPLASNDWKVNSSQLGESRAIT
jgi:hypothetical protein